METLLHQIRLLTQEEKLLKSEKRKRGEAFNIFEIMNAQRNEVSTHSAIIAELLNPKGSHGCESAFLSLFIQMFLDYQKESVISDVFINNKFNLSKWCSHIECNIGNKNRDKEDGGRLDILLESENRKQAIIIENKIYASDQPKQLYRYKRFADRQYGVGNSIIIYLTLDGHSPDNNSITGDKFTMKEGVDFYCVSYKSFIYSWLEACREKAVSKPLVRETIAQYYNLISHITYNMENTTTNKLIEILADRENISAIFKVRSVHYDVLNKACNTVLLKQIQEIADELGLQCNCSETDWCKQWSGQFFFSKTEWKYFSIGFEFMGNNLRNFNYGIRYKSESIKGSNPDKKHKLQEILGGSSNEWWASYKPFKYPDWDNEFVFERLYNGTIKSEIQQNIKDLVSIIEEANLDL